MEASGRNVSLRLKITILVSAIMAIALGVFASSLHARWSGELEESVIRESKATLAFISEAYPNLPTREFQLNLLKVASEQASIAAVTVRDADGVLVQAWPPNGLHLAPKSQREVDPNYRQELEVVSRMKLSDESFVTVTVTGDVLFTSDKVAQLVGVLFLFWLLLVAVTSGVTWFAARNLVQPYSELVDRLASIVETGDFTTHVEVESNDEAGQIAAYVRQVLDGQRVILKALKRSGEGLQNVISQLFDVGGAVSNGAIQIQALVRDTGGQIDSMLGSLRMVGMNVDNLQESAKRGSTEIVDMATNNDKLADTMQNMANQVNESAQGIDRIAVLVQETASNVNDLEGELAGASGSMTELMTAFQHVEQNAQDTVLLSSQASNSATNGGDALKATLHGIDKIKGASETAFDVINGLNDTTSEIGNIIAVIKGVADQTNLLALNASIIASQAGEHGKGFGVVADEIKNLAETTRSAAADIVGLIDKIQQESLHAIEAMSRGMENVAQGIKLGRQADEAFAKIQESTSSSSDMVQAIAQATQNQARQTKIVAGAIQRIALNVRQMARSATDQASNTREIRDGTRRMNALTETVATAGADQAQGSQLVIDAINEITEMVVQVSGAQERQKQNLEMIHEAVQLIFDVCADQDNSVREFDQAIVLLQAQAEDLNTELLKFKI